MNATLSRRPLRRFWGWGAASEQLTQDETARISMMVQMLGGQITDRPEPLVSDFVLPAPRIAPRLVQRCDCGGAGRRDQPVDPWPIWRCQPH